MLIKESIKNPFAPYECHFPLISPPSDIVLVDTPKLIEERTPSNPMIHNLPLNDPVILKYEILRLFLIY